MQKNNLLVWIDLEMTGLNPNIDTILEIAVVITDNNLNVIARGPDLIIYQQEETLLGMHEEVKALHHASGLYSKVLQSTTSLKQAEEQVLDFVGQYCTPKTALLCGNSVWMDKAFLSAHMRQLNDFFHYRIIDVSTLKELARRWYPHEKLEVTTKSKNHRALEDVLESIEEIKQYRKVMFK
jgi:oligoribonuclease